MRDQSRAARGPVQRFSAPAKLCRFLARLLGGRASVSAPVLDDRLRRDIGLPLDGRMGVSDVRAAFDRKLLEGGQPLP